MNIEFSVFDRLVEVGPNRRRESRSFERMIENVCRDVGWLLNTRREDQFDQRFDQAGNSLLTFGVVDFTSYNLTSSVDQERLRCSIERAIRQFEPRLSRVRVWMEVPDPVHPVLKFQIEALLRAGEIAEPVLLDARLQRDTRHIQVSGVEW